MIVTPHICTFTSKNVHTTVRKVTYTTTVVRADLFRLIQLAVWFQTVDVPGAVIYYFILFCVIAYVGVYACVFVCE